MPITPKFSECKPFCSSRGTVARIGFGIVGLAVAVLSTRFDLFASASAPPSPHWCDEMKFFQEELALQNTPILASVESDGRGNVIVTVANEGSTTLTYSSVGRSGITLFQEFEERGAWIPGGWDWCGTGKSEYELDPGDRVCLNVNFWDLRRERMLALFTEKGTDRSGIVVLATEGRRLVPNLPRIILLLGSASAAFYVWLGVRIINRQGRRAKWIAVGVTFTLLILPVAYVLSYGPAAAWASDGYLPHELRWFYLPLSWIKDHGPLPIHDAILWYDWSW